MTPIPPPIVEVTVPEYFSPSALGASADCRLRLAVMSLPRTETVERLAAGPEAAVGTLLHRVLERASRETTSPDEIFRDEYERAVDEIRRDPRRAHFVELASTRSITEWARVKGWVLARAARGRPTATARGTGAGRARPIVGTEVGFESRSLRLRGRADKIRQLAPLLFEVRDFKTGATLDEEGEIKPEIALQLRAYGLLLLERRRGVEVRLVVDDGEERDVSFDADSQRAAESALRRITGSMPEAGPTPSVALATPGRSCWGCPIRHVCPAYRAAAPSWWRQYPAGVERVSNDIWGAATDVLGEGRVDVVLRDDAGRRVRIDGLDERHGITKSAVGSRLWFFGLEATGATRGFDGSRFHPRSFHEIPRDRLERRAWSLQAFVDLSAC